MGWLWNKTTRHLSTTACLSKANGTEERLDRTDLVVLSLPMIGVPIKVPNELWMESTSHASYIQNLLQIRSGMKLKKVLNAYMSGSQISFTSVRLGTSYFSRSQNKTQTKIRLISKLGDFCEYRSWRHVWSIYLPTKKVIVFKDVTFNQSSIFADTLCSTRSIHIIETTRSGSRIL